MASLTIYKHRPQTTNTIGQIKSSTGINIGVFILLIFAFARPLATSFHHIGSISILEIFGIGSSYLLMIGLFFSLKYLRFNTVLILICFFAFYSLLSMLWGSAYRDLARMIFPFLTFFVAYSSINEESHIKIVLKALICGYAVPILGSAFLILTGKSETVVMSNLWERQEGLSAGVHTLGHSMLFFSFIYCLYQVMFSEKSKAWNFFITILLLTSLFCLYKTYTRTVFLGALIFWSIFLWSYNKKAFFILCISGLLLGLVFYSADVENLIWQTRGLSKKVHDLNVASSGRLHIWTNNLKFLADLPLTIRILGVGLGHGLDRIPGSFKMWIGSHNDYLELLITLGVFGFVYEFTSFCVIIR